MDQQNMASFMDQQNKASLMHQTKMLYKLLYVDDLVLIL